MTTERFNALAVNPGKYPASTLVFALSHSFWLVQTKELIKEPLCLCYQRQLWSDLAHKIFNGPYIKRADPLHMPGDFTSSQDYLESPCSEPSLNLIKTIKTGKKMKRLIGGNCHWSRRGGCSGDS